MAIQCPHCSVTLYLNEEFCPFCQRPITSGQGANPIQATLIDHAVPWTPHDVWVGVACQWLLWLLHLLALVLIRVLSLPLNVGILVMWTELLLFVTVWFLTVRKYRAEWQSLGLRRFSGKALGLGGGLLLFFYAFSGVYQICLTAFRVQMQQKMVPVFATLSLPWGLWVGMVGVAPVVEELFFRGFVFGGLRPRYGWQKAAVISGALFALIHLQWTTLLPDFVFGYLLAYLYARSDSICPGMLMHALINAWVLGAAYFAAQ